jgi:predicted Fe-Mo cluster-binding NifX family protein
MSTNIGLANMMQDHFEEAKTFILAKVQDKAERRRAEGIESDDEIYEPEDKQRYEKPKGGYFG